MTKWDKQKFIQNTVLVKLIKLHFYSRILWPSRWDIFPSEFTENLTFICLLPESIISAPLLTLFLPLTGTVVSNRSFPIWSTPIFLYLLFLMAFSNSNLLRTVLVAPSLAKNFLRKALFRSMTFFEPVPSAARPFLLRCLILKFLVDPVKKYYLEINHLSWLI